MEDFVNNPRDVEKHLDTLNKSCGDLESLCNQCGGCCCAEVTTKSVDNHFIGVVVDELPCKHLIRKSGDTFECSCYEERFEKTDWCLDLFSAMVKGALVETCPYVQDFDGYRGKQFLNDHEYLIIRPELVKAIKDNLELLKSIDAFDESDIESFLGESIG